MLTVTHRLDLTHARPGRRIYRSLTLAPTGDGGARLALHLGPAELGAYLSAADLAELVGMVRSLQLAQQCAEVPA